MGRWCVAGRVVGGCVLDQPVQPGPDQGGAVRVGHRVLAQWGQRHSTVTWRYVANSTPKNGAKPSYDVAAAARSALKLVGMTTVG